ncbi:ATPase family AAA domain-containing protein 2-like isoform X2 [Pristis pectinata]|uniref:ATPase family AAA domain-containing protein 2-like isoform X2 n=1 Tax=Pristis pectinata TaxID=685728 RepID=UPI00223D3C23|nr:ATPase family AAA domain-containing protein 2-like isoform X2 [Pristis pectinata]
MVMLRSGASLCLNSSSEFIALSVGDSPAFGKRGRGSSRYLSRNVKESSNGNLFPVLNKKTQLHLTDTSLDSSCNEKTMEESCDNGEEVQSFTRQSVRLKTKGRNKVPITRSVQCNRSEMEVDGVQEEGGIDTEVRRSCRLRRNRYNTLNQSVLFDKLITNTAEAVLQKMDDMKKLRRQRMRELENLRVINDTEEEEENLDVYSCVKKKRTTQTIDEETTEDHEDGSGELSEEEGEDREEDGEEGTPKRYYLRQRKTVVKCQAPEPERKRTIFYRGPTSPVRQRYRFSTSGSRSPYRKRKITRRRHAIHSSDSTSSSSSSSSDEEEGHFERRRNKTRSRALLRCLPLNVRKDDMKGIYRDRMKIGASLADVDPMQIDTSVRFSSVGGLTSHIAALKEMVVFPLLYPEVFERFKIQPPRGCLFYGPPGTGKTLVARALANECSQGDRRVSFFMRKGADCLSKWVGESERQLRLLFDQAYLMRPSIIFFDEVDGLAPVRSSRQDQIHSSIVSTLLALMDGLDSRGEIVVIGATNRLDSIDPALRRPGRFDREFLFGLPDKDAREEILKIHTRDWNPKPSDAFLQELAEKCVGYCGADIKAVCAEAALCALRRRYPQIYVTTEKLLLDVSSINITAQDFVKAMQKIMPASQRTVASPAQALSFVVRPLLENTFSRILNVLEKIFPYAEQDFKKNGEIDGISHILNDGIYSDDEGPSVFENGPNQKSSSKQDHGRSFLSYSRCAYHQPTSYRPRLLLAGVRGSGQSSHLAPALLHNLERYAVHTLDLPVLYGVSTTSPEETCAMLFREARKTAPSILYIPHIDQWWESVGDTLRATFISLLQDIPSFTPILLLATCDVPHNELAEEVKELFARHSGEVFNVPLPNNEERKKFFEDLILKQAAKPPSSKRKAILQALEVLPIAPPPEPQRLSEEEVKRLEEEEEGTLRELRLFLRDVTHRLANDKRFRAFTKPVDVEEVPDYCTVIKQPMDLSTIMSNIDLHKYMTVKEYLHDIELICNNALEYNPDRDPADRLIRHRACALKDTAYAIMKSELDEEFEKLCEETQESRKNRGCYSSKFAPIFYHVLPKNSTVDKRSDLELSSQRVDLSSPVSASTPSTLGHSKRKYRRSRWHRGIYKCKRKRPSQNISEDADSEDVIEGIDNPDDSRVDKTDCNEDVFLETQKQHLHNGCGINKLTEEITEEQPDALVSAGENVCKKRKLSTNETKWEENELGNGYCHKNQQLETSEHRERRDKPYHSEDNCSILHMTRSKRVQVEQQQHINVEKAMKVLSEHTPSVIVDHERLMDLWKLITLKSEGCTVTRLEKLYAVLSQCIYYHRKEFDKTMLIHEMENEVRKLCQS